VLRPSETRIILLEKSDEPVKVNQPPTDLRISIKFAISSKIPRAEAVPQIDKITTRAHIDFPVRARDFANEPWPRTLVPALL
jgi:hypothetical protein